MQLRYSERAALPLWARLAIERLECDETLRTEANLNYLLNAYAKITGHTPDVTVCTRVVAMCRQRGLT